jgi:2-methylaconitate isomerase
MQQIAIPAVFMRGGTSKALVFHRKDLPEDRRAWAPIFLAALGSPDPYGRQLDGMGGGLSSLSKVCVVGPSAHPDADVDYIFGQVEVGRARVDFSGRCGSMAAAIGPFAVDEGLVAAPADGEATVRIRDANVDRMIVSRFPVQGGRAAVEGALALDGVAGTGAPVRLAFVAPAGEGTGKLLPTGNVRDVLRVPGIGEVAYSFVDAGNPCMFVAASSLGLTGRELPAEIEAAPGLLDKLETIRRHASVAAGAARDVESAAGVSIPRTAIVAEAADSPTLSGRTLRKADADIHVRMIARGLPNRAVPVTAALSLAVACRLWGTIPNSLLAREAGDSDGGIGVGHPSGAWKVDVKVTGTGADAAVEHAVISLTARRLFQGEVLVPVARTMPATTAAAEAFA